MNVEEGAFVQDGYLWVDSPNCVGVVRLGDTGEVGDGSGVPSCLGV